MAIRFDGERIFASNVTQLLRRHQGRAPAVPVRRRRDGQQHVYPAARSPWCWANRWSVSSPSATWKAIRWCPPCSSASPRHGPRPHRILHAGARLVSDQFVTKPARTSYARQLQGYGLVTPKGTPITDETYRWSHAIIQTGTASLDFPRRNINPKVHYVGALLPHRAEPPPTATDAAAAASPPRTPGSRRRRRHLPDRRRHPGNGRQQGPGQADDPHH